MQSQGHLHLEAFTAHLAEIRRVRGMAIHVGLVRGPHGEALAAQLALIRRIRVVSLRVLRHLGARPESSPALVANEGLFLGVDSLVLHKCRLLTELLAAEAALKVLQFVCRDLFFGIESCRALLAKQSPAFFDEPPPLADSRFAPEDRRLVLGGFRRGPLLLELLLALLVLVEQVEVQDLPGQVERVRRDVFVTDVHVDGRRR